MLTTTEPHHRLELHRHSTTYCTAALCHRSCIRGVMVLPWAIAIDSNLWSSLSRHVRSVGWRLQIKSLAPCGDVKGSIGSLCGCVPMLQLCTSIVGMVSRTVVVPRSPLNMVPDLSVRAGRTALCRHGSITRTDWISMGVEIWCANETFVNYVLHSAWNTVTALMVITNLWIVPSLRCQMSKVG